MLSPRTDAPPNATFLIASAVTATRAAERRGEDGEEEERRRRQQQLKWVVWSRVQRLAVYYNACWNHFLSPWWGGGTDSTSL